MLLAEGMKPVLTEKRNMKKVKELIQDIKGIGGLEDCGIGGLEDCGIGGLEDCGIGGTPNFQTSKLPTEGGAA